MNPQMEQCIQECQSCQRACLETFARHCLMMGGAHVAQPHARLMLDCAETCQTSANFMIRDSERHRLTCGICADICQQCADDCARFTDSPEMLRCAEERRRCAEMCRRMAGQMAGAAV